MTITLTTARTIIEAARHHGRTAGLKPLAILVLDAGGHLVAFDREDGAAPGRYHVAHGKAYGAISIGVSSRTLGTMAVERPHFVAGATAAIGGALVPVAGGVLVRDGDRIVGAVGVSGDSSDNDEAAAIAGITAAGLQPSEQ
jgi:uncharacterized protein GlcG (DUF336 family)